MPNPNITKMYLLDVPLENDYQHTLYFENAAAQQQYFQSRIVKSYTDFSYQRKDKIIRIPEQYDSIYNVNYVMYQNAAYSNKWFYAFVTDLEYINDGRTDLHIETDVIQTWLFDYQIKESFVEREHTDNDTIGNNIVDEGLELGEYVANGKYNDPNMDDIASDLCYIMGTTVGTILDGDKFPAIGGDVYNGIYSGVKYYRFDNPSAIDIILEAYANHGQSDAVTGIFMIPKVLAPLNQESQERQVASSNTTKDYEITVNKVYGLNNYVPKNNKLKTFPFCYILASNNQGGNAIYHYEDFNSEQCKFTVRCALTPGGSIRMTPRKFKGVEYNDEESINLGKFPICNYANDMYTNWLTQNSVNLATSFISSGAQVIGGVAAIATGAGAVAGTGMVANGLLGITNTLGEIRKASLVPPQVQGNLNCGDVVTSSNTNNFHFYYMSIKRSYAQIIDRYFDMFGYKTNLVKIPNTAHRSKYWFTKTLDVNIDGNIPQNDMQKIKNCYNNGITFWRNASEIQDYSVRNDIV